jgi:hypothetical protein
MLFYSINKLPVETCGVTIPTDFIFFSDPFVGFWVVVVSLDTLLLMLPDATCIFWFCMLSDGVMFSWRFCNYTLKYKSLIMVL